MAVREVSSYRIADMDPSERPREKLAREGVSALNNAELLAILLRVGVEGENAVRMADRIINKHKGLRGLYHTPYEELCSEYGLGPAKAAQILAALELGVRAAKADSHRQSIHNPTDIYDLVKAEMSLLNKEQLRVLALDTKNNILANEVIYTGSVNSSQVRVGEVLKLPIRLDAASFVVIHNHPSGDPTPSPDDVALTRSLRESGKLVDIELLDHIIVGNDRFVSLKERGLGF